MNHLPKDIEDLIIDYRNQLEKTEKFDKVVKELKSVVRCVNSVAWNETSGFGVACVSIDKFDNTGFNCFICARFCLICGNYYGVLRDTTNFGCLCNPNERTFNFVGNTQTNNQNLIKMFNSLWE